MTNHQTIQPHFCLPFVMKYLQECWFCWCTRYSSTSGNLWFHLQIYKIFINIELFCASACCLRRRLTYYQQFQLINSFSLQFWLYHMSWDNSINTPCTCMSWISWNRPKIVPKLKIYTHMPTFAVKRNGQTWTIDSMADWVIDHYHYRLGIPRDQNYFPYQSKPS